MILRSQSRIIATVLFATIATNACRVQHVANDADLQSDPTVLDAFNNLNDEQKKNVNKVMDVERAAYSSGQWVLYYKKGNDPSLSKVSYNEYLNDRNDDKDQNYFFTMENEKYIANNETAAFQTKPEFKDENGKLKLVLNMAAYKVTSKSGAVTLSDPIGFTNTSYDLSDGAKDAKTQITENDLALKNFASQVSGEIKMQNTSLNPVPLWTKRVAFIVGGVLLGRWLLSNKYISAAKLKYRNWLTNILLLTGSLLVGYQFSGLLFLENPITGNATDLALEKEGINICRFENYDLKFWSFIQGNQNFLKRASYLADICRRNHLSPVPNNLITIYLKDDSTISRPEIEIEMLGTSPALILTPINFNKDRIELQLNNFLDQAEIMCKINNMGLNVSIASNKFLDSPDAIIGREPLENLVKRAYSDNFLGVFIRDGYRKPNLLFYSNVRIRPSIWLDFSNPSQWQDYIKNGYQE